MVGRRFLEHNSPYPRITRTRRTMSGRTLVVPSSLNTIHTSSRTYTTNTNSSPSGSPKQRKTENSSDPQNEDKSGGSTLHASSLVTFTHDPKEKIGYITLNSPFTYNALSVEMGHEFEALIHKLTLQLNDHQQCHDNDLHKEVGDISSNDTNDYPYQEANIKNTNVIILKGANHNFSSGGDLSWLKSLRRNPVHINADKMYCFYKSFLSIRNLPVPTIAHVEGYAIGAGACLALATDLRIMHEKAKIGFNFVKLGIHSGMGGSHLLANTIGESKSKLALLTGQVFTAQQAFENGIAHDLIVENKQQNNDNDNDVVIDLAKKIASMHPLAIRSMVQTARMREDAMGGVGGLDATMRKEAYAQALCYARDDWGEGLDAVIERRQPDFNNYHDGSDW